MPDLDGRIAMARRHVEGGLDILDRQRRLIELRHALKLDVAAAEDLLDRFEASQAIFEDDLFRLLKERDGK